MYMYINAYISYIIRLYSFSTLLYFVSDLHINANKENKEKCIFIKRRVLYLHIIVFKIMIYIDLFDITLILSLHMPLVYEQGARWYRACNIFERKKLLHNVCDK